MNDSTVYAALLDQIVEQLTQPDLESIVTFHRNKKNPMPSINVLHEMMEVFRDIIFPGYYMESSIHPESLSYYIGGRLDRFAMILSEQIKRGYCFVCQKQGTDSCDDCEEEAHRITHQVLAQIPDIRKMLAQDVVAAYEGDPAATSYGEAIFCYPSIRCLTNFRLAHTLYELEVPIIPRVITELAHSQTGIDIHPGAEIGESFFMDHGTGIVIGGTCIIGNHVKIYQHVTLGAKSFPLDEQGKPIKGIKRHPIVEDHVVIYSGATLLGRITIGTGSVIGGNVWIMEDVPPYSKIYFQPNRC